MHLLVGESSLGDSKWLPNFSQAKTAHAWVHVKGFAHLKVILKEFARIQMCVELLSQQQSVLNLKSPIHP